MATQIRINGDGFLPSFSTTASPAKLIIPAETDDFDQVTLQDWRNEGYDVTYLPLNNGGKAYTNQLRSIGDQLSVSESYAIVGKAFEPRTCATMC